MSRHEGVSCDSCLKGNFRGRRYKCLICYDYDLCSTCYESGVTTTRHSSSHPMQCILTRDLIHLFYGGDAASPTTNASSGAGGASAGHHHHQGAVNTLAQSYTCPFCSGLGFTEASLAEHVTSQHNDATQEVVCPICAAMPGHDPNHVTDDFSAHITLEHRGGGHGGVGQSGSIGSGAPRDLISFLDGPNGGPRSSAVRRVPHASRNVTGSAAAARARRSANVHNPNPPPSLLSSLSPSSLASRDAVDPIAELLSQLSGVRRAATSSANSSSSISSQFHQLQMQLQLERQQAQAQRLEQRVSAAAAANAAAANATARARLGYPAAASSAASTSIGGAILQQQQQQHVQNVDPNVDLAMSNAMGLASSTDNGQFLLRQCSDEESEDSPDFQAAAVNRQSKSQFVQDLVLSTLVERVTLKEGQVSQDHSVDLL